MWKTRLQIKFYKAQMEPGMQLYYEPREQENEPPQNKSAAAASGAAGAAALVDDIIYVAAYEPFLEQQLKF